MVYWSIAHQVHARSTPWVVLSKNYAKEVREQIKCSILRARKENAFNFFRKSKPKVKK